MAERGTVYHNENLGSEIPPYEYAGENVGMGPDCETIFAAFKASRGHYENILDADFERLGVGVSSAGEDLFVTLDFFTPSKSRPKPKPPTQDCKP
jgi:uncharacterized protein YkwD